MFVGHLALGYAARRWVPHVSLAVLLAASQLADLIWPVLLAAGLEHVRIVPGITAATPLEFVSYPYSHSLAALIVWGALFGWICAAPPGRVRVAAIIGLLVVSHWVLDVWTHLPDMPIYPGGPKLGFGLWQSLAATRAIELTMFAAGAALYLRATIARDWIGRWATYGLMGFLLAGYLMAGTPPPSIDVLWVAALTLGALIVVWAWWADAHRTAKNTNHEDTKARRTTNGNEPRSARRGET